MATHESSIRPSIFRSSKFWNAWAATGPKSRPSKCPTMRCSPLWSPSSKRNKTSSAPNCLRRTRPAPSSRNQRDRSKASNRKGCCRKHGGMHRVSGSLTAQQLILADWLEELAVYGTATRFQDTETAYHLSQAIKHSYLVKLAIEHCAAPLPEVGVFCKTPRPRA